MYMILKVLSSEMDPAEIRLISLDSTFNAYVCTATNKSKQKTSR
jgi:hypothetical protein